MVRHFFRNYHVRHDEVNPYGWLSPAAALRYMQDIASLDAAEAPMPDDSMWVARRNVVEFVRPVAVRSNLAIETYPMGFTKVTAQRAYDVRLLATSELVIRGRTLWVYLDARNRPRRMPEIAHQFWLPDGSIPQREERPFPAFPNTPPHTRSFSVPISYLDVMGHVNNTKYVELLDDILWELTAQFGLKVGENTDYLVPLHYDIEYLEAAQFGDIFEIQSWWVPNPTPATEFVILQQILKNKVVIVRAHSRWIWRINAD